jgi:hypothetical protein
MSFGMLCHVVWWKFTGVSEVLVISIIKTMMALMMEAASTSETSVNFCEYDCILGCCAVSP